MRQLIYIIKYLRHYCKYRLPIIGRRYDDDQEHYHICYPARLLGKDAELVCPYIRRRKNFHPEFEDECDQCPYFGIVDFPEDDNLRLTMDDRIVNTFHVDPGPPKYPS